MAYTLEKFNQARDTAHAQGRQMTQQEFTGIGGTASDFPLVYGGSTGTPGQPQGATAAPQQGTTFGGPQQYGSGLATGGYSQQGSGQPQYGATGGQQPQGSFGTTGAPVPGQAGGLATARGGAPSGAPTGSFNLSGMPNPQGGAMPAISTQFGLNQQNIAQQQQLNRVNEVGPYGSAQYIQNPDGSITRQYSLSDPQQALLNQQQSRDIALGDTAADSFYQMRNQYSQPLSLEQLGAMGQLDYSQLPQLLGADDMMGQRDRTESAVYDSFARRNEPNFQREEEAMYQSLADRGIPRDSQRAKIEIENMKQQQSDARLNAQNAARLAGLQELQGLFGLSSDARSQLGGEQKDLYSASNQNRERTLNEMLLQRDRPASELATLLGLQRGITNPEFSQIGNINVPGIDAIGAGLGFRGDETNRYLGQLQAETAKANAAAANALGYAKLGAEERYQQQLLALEQQKLEQGQSQFNTLQGNQPGFWDFAGSTAAGGFGQYAGNAAGQWVFG